MDQQVKIDQTNDKRRFQIVELEERFAPSVAGITNALTNNGAEHRSDNATDALTANLARQSH